MSHITLRDVDSGSTARIAPDFGFNCFEFVAHFAGKEVEVLAALPSFIELGEKPSWNGIPILFPFPNRIRNGEYDWDDQAYLLPKEEVSYSGPNAIHGFCLDRPWRITQQTGNSLTGEFHFSKDDPARRPLWPADFIIQVRYEVLGPALRCDIRIQNPDDKTLPFSLGTHPYFKVPLASSSKFDECLIEVPAAARWKLDGGLPTGQLDSAAETVDLREGIILHELKLDDVYTDLSYESNGLVTRVVDPQAGLQVTQSCDKSFREVVVFTPHWSPAVCLEPYTATTDAINLQAKGIDAGLRSLAPREEFKTWFELRVEPVVV